MLLQMAVFRPFYSWVVFHCIYVLRLLYPFICQWTFRLLPSLGYCQECCFEYRGTKIFLNYNFVQIYAWIGIAGSYGTLLLVFWETSILFSIIAAPTYIPHQQCQRVPFSPLPRDFLKMSCLCSHQGWNASKSGLPDKATQVVLVQVGKKSTVLQVGMSYHTQFTLPLSTCHPHFSKPLATGMISFPSFTSHSIKQSPLSQ